MSRGDDLDAFVHAFREATATPADGRATRARVLAASGEHIHRRRILGRFWLAAAIGLLILTSAAVAWTGLRWRRLVPAYPSVRPPEHAAVAKVPAVALPLPEVEPVPPSPLSRRPLHQEGSHSEARAYERAHRAHFFAHSPERALAAWDDYLRDHRRGVFAPEARFNRALCLIHLTRYELAAEALRPFAAGEWHGYRSREARVLLDWMSAKRTASDSDAR
jgi:hypothetical protein